MIFSKFLDKFKKRKTPIEDTPNITFDLNSQVEDDFELISDETIYDDVNEIIPDEDVELGELGQEISVEEGQDEQGVEGVSSEDEKLMRNSKDLTKFFETNWWGLGRRDGYRSHSSEYLRKKKMNIISEFQKLCEYRIDELKEEKLKCSSVIIDIGDISQQINEKFTLRINMCVDYIEDLHKEKQLSQTNGGLIRSVISEYEVGWEMGVSEYLMENHFLNPPKRL